MLARQCVCLFNGVTILLNKFWMNIQENVEEVSLGTGNNAL